MNARIAGYAFLIYIGAGLSSMALFGRVLGGATMADKLASVGAHASAVGPIVLLGFVQAFCAIVLGVTLWAITRDQDSDLAMLGLSCRVSEGVVAGLAIPTVLAVAALATTAAADPGATTAAETLARYLLRPDIEIPATFFAVGSTFFSWLLLRGRMIPVGLAWLGVVASVLLVIALPLQLAGFLRGSMLMLIWLPMLVFELVLALWLIIKGVAAPTKGYTAAVTTL